MGRAAVGLDVTMWWEARAWTARVIAPVVSLSLRPFRTRRVVNYIAHRPRDQQASWAISLLNTDGLFAVGIVTGDSFDMSTFAGHLRSSRSLHICNRGWGRYRFRLKDSLI